MKRLDRVCLVMVLAAGVVGCTCPTWTFRQQRVDGSDFERIERGMSRGQVLDILGRPTDVSRDAMHWEVDRYTDVWVFFSADGRRVTGKYRQDGENLRLGESPPVGG